MEQQQNGIVPAPPPAPTTRSIVRTMAERFGMEAPAFEKTLMETVMPKSSTRESVAAFLVVAHEHGLNPFTREIFAFEGQGGGVRPIVSIDGWYRIVNQHPQTDGFELEEIFDDQHNLIAVEARMHRKDRSHPIVLREYLVECVRGTDPWKRWPRRMLRHKAFIQCARAAFGFAGIEDEDEYERASASIQRSEPEIARIDLSRARAGTAVNPPGGAPIRTVQATAAPVESEPAQEPEPVDDFAQEAHAP